MAKTISTHNGSAAHRDHNIRRPKVTEKQGHIDPALRGKNIVLHDEDPRAAYRRIFGAALDEYNRKQPRADRRIQDYYSKISRDQKKHPVYEMIVQIGDRYDTGLEAETEKECLVEFYRGWAERNPQLECIGAYVHADETEGTVHLHLDYVPVATGYTRGMAVQAGLVKALEQQGFVKAGKLTAQIQWEARENQALEHICLDHGIEVVHPKRDQVKHLDTQLYKAQQEAAQASQMARAKEDALHAIERCLAAVEPPEAFDSLDAKKTITGKIVLPQQNYSRILTAAQASAAAKTHAAEQTAQNLRLNKQLDSRDEELQDLRRQLADVREKLRDFIDWAVTELRRLWNQFVAPIRKLGNKDAWSFSDAACWAIDHDRQHLEKMDAVRPQIMRLENAVGGSRTALDLILTSEGYSEEKRISILDEKYPARGGISMEKLSRRMNGIPMPTASDDLCKTVCSVQDLHPSSGLEMDL